MKTNLNKNRNARMIATASMILFNISVFFTQQVYDNFEGDALVSYVIPKYARVDTVNIPAPNKINSSLLCAKYVRGRLRYDNIKMPLKGKVSNLEDYSSQKGSALKIKMKVFTTAPVGTLVEIQLGKSVQVTYPDGTHSQYQARTTKTGTWEELEFNFVTTPQGSKTLPSEVDQVVLLFNPNTNTTDTWYFDDLTGPAINVSPVKASAKR
jgi:hypothetical protein